MRKGAGGRRLSEPADQLHRRLLQRGAVDGTAANCRFSTSLLTASTGSSV